MSEDLIIETEYSFEWRHTLVATLVITVSVIGFLTAVFTLINYSRSRILLVGSAPPPYEHPPEYQETDPPAYQESDPYPLRDDKEVPRIRPDFQAVH